MTNSAGVDHEEDLFINEHGLGGSAPCQVLHSEIRPHGFIQEVNMKPDLTLLAWDTNNLYSIWGGV